MKLPSLVLEQIGVQSSLPNVTCTATANNAAAKNLARLYMLNCVGSDNKEGCYTQIKSQADLYERESNTINDKCKADKNTSSEIVAALAMDSLTVQTFITAMKNCLSVDSVSQECMDEAMIQFLIAKGVQADELEAMLYEYTGTCNAVGYTVRDKKCVQLIPKTPLIPVEAGPVPPPSTPTPVTPAVPGPPVTPGSPVTPATPAVPGPPGPPVTPGSPVTPAVPGPPGSPVTPAVPVRTLMEQIRDHRNASTSGGSSDKPIKSKVLKKTSVVTLTLHEQIKNRKRDLNRSVEKSGSSSDVVVVDTPSTLDVSSDMQSVLGNGLRAIVKAKLAKLPDLDPSSTDTTDWDVVSN